MPAKISPPKHDRQEGRRDEHLAEQKTRAERGGTPSAAGNPGKDHNANCEQSDDADDITDGFGLFQYDFHEQNNNAQRTDGDQGKSSFVVKRHDSVAVLWTLDADGIAIIP